VADRRRAGGRGRHAALTALLAAAALAGCGGDPERVDLLVTAPLLFDGERLVRDGAVAIRGDEVVAAGARDDVDVDAARTIELERATLLPGLVDLHVHGLAEAHSLSPVTTIRDVGSQDAALPARPSSGSEPRALLAGPLITAPGGYPIPVHGAGVAHVVRRPAQARAYVRSLAERGAAVVKVSLQFGFPVVTFDVLQAIVAEAHARDLRVTAHVGEAQGTRMAVSAGVDELAHMPCERDPVLMRRLAAAGIEIVGTLHVVELYGCTTADENARAFVAAGGTLLYGSDYGNPGIPAGLDLAELERMREAGLSRLDVLTNATAGAGAVAGVPGLGRIAAGSPADVVAVRGDPTRDLSALRRAPWLVILRCEIVLGP
jgi:imidazolonepropionase-like amidohydrolase